MDFDNALAAGDSEDTAHPRRQSIRKQAVDRFIWLLSHGCLQYSSFPGDTAKQRERKKFLILLFNVSLILSVSAGVGIGVSTGLRSLQFVMGMALVCISSIAGHIVLKASKHASDRFLFTYLCAWGLGIIMCDLYATSLGRGRLWQLLIIPIDILLLLAARTTLCQAYVFFSALWIIVVTLDLMFPFGLIDIIGGVSAADRREIACGCDQPPCAYNGDYVSGFVSLLTQLAVILLDFSFTQGFASELRQEQDKMAAVVEAANLISMSLAEFDLETAEQVLSGHAKRLPPGMVAAFWRILNNLQCYRPYLPDTLFDELHDPGQQRAKSRYLMPPPGMKESMASLVFTDIKGSTSLWEAVPDAMKRSLKMHNKVIREALDVWSGYEVKTIGDAFMVSFAAADHAVNFSLAVQTGLVDAQWPSALLQLPQCKRDEVGTWGGIVVRIGVHHGEVAIEQNKTNGRVDYLGHTVNKAARLEGKCVPGCVAVSSDVLELLDASTKVSEHIRISMGEVKLVGVTDPEHATLLIPTKLKERQAYAVEKLADPDTELPMVAAHYSNSMPSDAGGNLGGDFEFFSMARVGSIRSSLTHHSHYSRETVCPVGHATIAAVKMIVPDVGKDGEKEFSSSNPVQNLAATLTSVATAMERTEGNPVALAGTTLILAWNALSRCLGHVENSLRFLKLCGANLGVIPSRDYLAAHIGLSTGEVVSGHVGTYSQRFICTAGPCVQAAQLSSSAAQRVQMLCLYTPISSTLLQDPAKKSMMRPIERWEDPSEGLLFVYEVEHDNMSFFSMKTNQQRRSLDNRGWCWSSGYWAAFSSNDGTEILARANEEVPPDPILCEVGMRMRRDAGKPFPVVL